MICGSILPNGLPHHDDGDESDFGSMMMIVGEGDGDGDGCSQGRIIGYRDALAKIRTESSDGRADRVHIHGRYQFARGWTETERWALKKGKKGARRSGETGRRLEAIPSSTPTFPLITASRRIAASNSPASNERLSCVTIFIGDRRTKDGITNE